MKCEELQEVIMKRDSLEHPQSPTEEEREQVSKHLDTCNKCYQWLRAHNAFQDSLFRRAFGGR